MFVATPSTRKTTAMKKTKVALYGRNGHQIGREMAGHPGAELVAVAGIPAETLPEPCRAARQYPSLDALLGDSEVELVSLCSPFRRDQAADAIKCLRAGKHVYAEKPAALNEADLDAIIATARATGRQFHEMAGTLLTQPYMAAHHCIAAGQIGEVVQIFAQKCYPWADWRPVDEAIDGGLGLQVGVYIGRFIEHVAGQRIASIQMCETQLGNDPARTQCRRACSMLIELANGGVASAVCNYLNPVQKLAWGYEIVRVFGTGGIVETNALTQEARLLRLGQEPELLNTSEAAVDYFSLFVEHLRTGLAMPLSLEDELSPTRWALRAKAQAKLTLPLP